MFPEDDRMVDCFKCFNVHFRLLKSIYVHLLVCYLNNRSFFSDSKGTYDCTLWENCRTI